MTASQFWESLERKPSGCWVWQGALHTGGYGCAWDSDRKRRLKTHRWAMELTLGRTLTRQEFVLHHCDNPPCCNPDHLYVGCHTDNMLDCKSRGRGAVGDRHGRSKLTAAQVETIRRPLYVRGLHRRLAADYGVTESTISVIRNGKKWRSS